MTWQNPDWINFFRTSRFASRVNRRQQRAATLPPRDTRTPNRSGGSSPDSADELMSISQRDDGEMDDDIADADAALELPEPEVVPLPTHRWECEHCTYVNKPGTRVCSVCCKTTLRGGRRGSDLRETKQETRRSSRTEPPKWQQEVREEEITKAVSKQLRLIQDPDAVKTAKKKGRPLRRISFWPGTKFFA